jgi:exosortase
MYQLSGQWYFYDQYHYGWAMPFLSLYLLRRRLLFEAQIAHRPGRKGRPAFLILSCTAILYAPTRWLCEANPIWRLTISLWASEVITVTLCVVYLLRDRASLRQWLFPVSFFLLAVPWPSSFESFAIQFLSRFNSSLGVEALGFLGVPSLQHDRIIETAVGSLGVDEACSGLQSLQATLMLTVFFGEFYRMQPATRIVFALAGCLVCLVCNAVRTTALAWVATQGGLCAVSSWHDVVGLSLLLAMFLVLWLLALPLSSGACSAKTRTRHRINHDAGSVAVGIDAHRISISRLSFSLALWFVLVESGTRAWYFYHERQGKDSPDWSLKADAQLPGFQQLEVRPPIRDQFLADEAVEARWEGEAGIMAQAFYFRWRPARSLWDRVRSQLAKTHEPERCLPAQGLILSSDLGITTVHTHDLVLGFRHFIFRAGERPVHVFYGCYEDCLGGNAFAFSRQDIRSRVAAATAGSRNSGQRWLEVVFWGISNDENSQRSLCDVLPKLLEIRSPGQGTARHVLSRGALPSEN